jgi:hypothetical protein
MFQQVNLYTPLLRQEPKLFSAGAIAIALAIFAVGLLSITGVAWWRNAALDRELHELEAQRAAKSRLVNATAQLIHGEQDPVRIEAHLRDMALELERREKALRGLQAGAAGTRTGFADRMAALARQQVDGLWLHGVVFSSDSAHFTLSGSALRAELVPIYLARLANEDALAGASLESFEIRQPRRPSRGEVEFAVSSATVSAAASASSAADAAPAQAVRFADNSVFARAQP